MLLKYQVTLVLNAKHLLFISFLSVSVITSDSSKALTILVMSSKSLLENFTVFVPEFFEFPKP